MAPRGRTRRGIWARLLRWGVRGVTLCLLALLLAGIYLWVSTELPAPEQLRARAARGSTRILDRHGHLLYQVPDPFSGQQRPVPLDEIPLALRQATTAVEDRTFFSNSGIDLRGIIRAAWTNLHSGRWSAGGSTITQQLARNFLMDPELAQQRSLERKLREMVLALKLTASYSKDEILEMYLNQIYYGNLAYGVEAAAQHFFGKPVSDLDLAECALLAGLPQAPSRYNPFLNLEAALDRQHEVLNAMISAGYLTAQQAAAAREEPLQFATARTAMRAPHFVFYVLDLLAAQLGPDMVARGGLTIATTLDIDLQEAAQHSLARQLVLLSTPRNGQPNHQVHNGAVVVINPADGAILALVGSPDFYDRSIQGQVNAALAQRQPGSAIKPLTYAAALEGGWTPATTILDVPSSFATREGPPYTPKNYDRRYHGPISLREALATSSNIAAVRVLHEIGVPALLEMASRLGITSLGQDPGRYGLSLTLGGGEVTLLELTAAYATFANGGQRITPYAIISVTDVQGRYLRGNGRPGYSSQPQPALSPQVAYLISDILSDRYARMRAFGEQSVLDIDRPSAAKTGTTSGWRDNWTIGYTPDRVVGVWVGNADGRPMEAVSGISGAGPVWYDVMLAAHQDLPLRSFERPGGIIELEICAEGGLLPSPTCPATRFERFIAGTEPAKPDDTHIKLAIDPVLGCRAPVGYPAERTSERIYRILTAEAEAWAIDGGIPRIPEKFCPPLSAATATDGIRGADTLLPSMELAQSGSPDPALLFPAPGAVFSLSPDIPRERQRIALQARAGVQVAELTIVIDDQPVASFAQPPYRAFWELRPGTHRALVLVKDAYGRSWQSEEVKFVVTSEP